MNKPVKDNLESEYSGPAGTITFSSDAVASIVRYAISDMDGFGNQSKNVFDGIFGFFTNKTSDNKGIVAHVGKKEIALDLNIDVCYGVVIPELVQNIQQKLTRTLESITGLKVLEININVMNVIFKEND